MLQYVNPSYLYFTTVTYFYKQIHYSLVLRFSLLPLRVKFCNSELWMTQTSLKIQKKYLLQNIKLGILIQDPYPNILQMVDPDPYIMYLDPQHRLQKKCDSIDRAMTLSSQK
jgi:hypothetical protein